MVFLTMLLIPTLIALGFLVFGGPKITFKEFLCQIGIQVVLIAGCAFFVATGNTSDVEVLNGRVKSKAKEKVSCSHSYTCNCRTVCSGAGKSRSCSTVCSTCYEHSYDWDWAVYLDIGNRLEIDRIDRRGNNEPPRFTAVQIGEPASVTHGYTNYVKGSPDSLFRHQGLLEKYIKELPKYPSNIFDYYKVNRTILIGATLENVEQWNKELSETNAELGKTKQANLVLVFTKNKPQDYFYALEQHWIGGKKNDIVLVMDVNDAGILNWVNVMAWTNDKMVEVTLRDAIMKVGKVDRQQILSVAKDNINQFYVRKPMKDFEYLKSIVTPTTGQWVFSMIVGLIASIGLGIFFHRNDTFGEEYINRYIYRR